MPELIWSGKDKVKFHHHDVPFHLLNEQYRFNAESGRPQNREDNILIHGDNLLALKSLLPEFGGKINCIYIDPPYNTGNENWVYNDNVNDPRIQKWLGEVVGKEGEDFSRHDKWLCMMYPRLKLLKQLLANDGVILVHIDENADNLLHGLMIEIFDKSNELGRVIWDKKNPKGDAKKLSYQHESIFIFCKSGFHEKCRLRRAKKNAPAMLKKAKILFKKIGKKQYPDDLKETVKKYGLPEEILAQHAFVADLEWVNQEFQNWLKKQNFSNGEKAYKFIDENGDVFRPVSMAWPNKEVAPGDYFIPLKHPITGLDCPVPERGWRFPSDTMKIMLENDEIIFGKNETAQPQNKYLLKEHLFENIPSVISFGGSDDTLHKHIGIKLEHAKPYEFVKELLSYFTDKNSVILDSFIGSGTTAHAVLSLNHQDGGIRKFIGIELMNYAEETTAKRIRTIVDGYEYKSGKSTKFQNGTGGGFTFYTVGDPLFTAPDTLNPAAPLAAVRTYIGYTEDLQQTWLPENGVSPHALGYQNGTAYVFYYEADCATTLDWAFLQTLNAEGLPEKPERWVIYADKVVLTAAQLQKANIVFKRIPRDISRF